MITTIPDAATDSGFRIDKTKLINGTLYVATIHIPNVTQPLYEVVNPKSPTQTAIVNSDEDLHRLMSVHNFTVKSIMGYSMVDQSFDGVTKRYLSWSNDPPGDSIVSDEEEYTRYTVRWRWKPQPPLYLFDKQKKEGVCKLERSKCKFGLDWICIKCQVYSTCRV
jgi:hypothetical protein